MNKPVAWTEKDLKNACRNARLSEDDFFRIKAYLPVDTNPVELTDEDIAKVVHELNQKANTPERWVTAMQIGAETIIQLRDELAILRKAQEK